MTEDFATIRAKGTWTLQKRSDFRKQVRNGEISLPETLEQYELPDWLQNAKLDSILRAHPGVGKVTAEALVWRSSHLRANPVLSSIPHSRRVELAEALRERS